MSDTPIGDQAAAGHPYAEGLDVVRPAAVATMPDQAELEQLLGARVLPVRQWIRALTDVEQFEEADEEDASLSIVRAILLAQTSEQVFSAMNITNVKAMIGEDPGARSNVLAITDAIPLRSTFEEGPSCFAVINARDLAESVDVTFSCGARAVQTAILAHIIHGWMPVKCRIVRRLKPTRSNFYPLNLEMGI